MNGIAWARLYMAKNAAATKKQSELTPSPGSIMTLVFILTSSQNCKQKKQSPPTGIGREGRRRNKKVGSSNFKSSEPGEQLKGS